MAAMPEKSHDNDELFERVAELSFALHAVLDERTFAALADYVRELLASGARILDGHAS